MQSVVAEPLDGWRKQNVPAKCSTGAPARTPGVAGTARREGKTLNVGDLDRSGWRPQPEAQGRKPRPWGRRGVGGVRSTCEGGESRWREGALLDGAYRAAKERGLWRH